MDKCGFEELAFFLETNAYVQFQLSTIYVVFCFHGNGTESMDLAPQQRKWHPIYGFILTICLNEANIDHLTYSNKAMR